MNLHLAVLSAYSLGLMALGLWIGRRVRGTSDFFVAGRELGPGLIFATMLAANIGAGSTVGATAQGYTTGVSTWWWVGSAAIGSCGLAFVVGPAMRRVAAAHDLTTVGDYLEHRYDRAVRGFVSALVWVASLFILASQLIGLGAILNVVSGLPKPIGCAIGAAVITVYFRAGGLTSSARVNVVQLAVKLGGFAIAVPLAVGAIGGWNALGHVASPSPRYTDFWRADTALTYLFAFAPAFVVSPGLLQKILGARDDRAVRAGVGWNALGLFLYAPVPVVLGMAARAMFPALADPQQALPAVLMNALPPFIGALGIAAVFSAEISAADAVLMILTTSFSEDLYRRFLARGADDARVLRVARWTTVVSAIAGLVLAIAAESILTVITIFYTLITVSLFVPIVAGLFSRRTTALGAKAAIVAGVGGALAIQAATGGRGWGMITPALGGLLLAAASWIVSLSRGAADGVVSDRGHRG